MARPTAAAALAALVLFAGSTDAFSVPASAQLLPPRSHHYSRSDNAGGASGLQMTAALDPGTGSLFPSVGAHHLRGGSIAPLVHRTAATGVSSQFVLIASAVLSYALVATIAPVTLMALFDDGFLLPFVNNLTPAALCFGGADVVTQLVSSREEQKKTGSALRVDAWRSLSASMIGVLCNAIGLTVWLHFLNTCLPASACGLSRGKLPLLVIKTMTHAFVWGTLSNSLSLVLRRMLAGDSPNKSVAFWNSKIIQVTRSNMAFWPVWMLLNFALVPQAMQVRVTAVGAFCFNIFMSYVSAQKIAHPATPPEAAPASPSFLVSRHPEVSSEEHTSWMDDEVFNLNDVISAAGAASAVSLPGLERSADQADLAKKLA